MDRGGKGKTAISEEEKADEPSILPMTPESKQLAAVIATAVATAMAGRSASPLASSRIGTGRYRTADEARAAILADCLVLYFPLLLHAFQTAQLGKKYLELQPVDGSVWARQRG